MNNFGSKSQKYATQKSNECQHPINRVDDNDICQSCGMDMNEQKHTKSFDVNTMVRATNEDVIKMFIRLWGWSPLIESLARNNPDVEYLDLTQEF